MSVNLILTDLYVVQPGLSVRNRAHWLLASCFARRSGSGNYFALMRAALLFSGHVIWPPLSKAVAPKPLGTLMPSVRRSVLARGLVEQSSAAASNVIAQIADAVAVAPDVVEVVKGRDADFLADSFESVLTALDTGLESLHVPYSYGFAIILLTVLVKALTFPLSKKQVESTVAMQALQPSIKQLQAKHAGDQETLQLETAKLYKDAGVNPLAGCLPTLATIPVFIGLYKSLSNAAADGLLDVDFFWIPNLAGPTSIASRDAGGGLSWLFPLVDGAPPIGWAQAGAYLVMPVLLVASQFASQKLMQPEKNADPSAAQTMAILKFLPFMIGWFSLNVPSGLTLYWFTNTALSTAQQMYLKANTKVTLPDEKPAQAGTVTIVKPKEDRESKKPVGKESNARGKKKGDKFSARKAKEDAQKSSTVAVAEPVEHTVGETKAMEVVEATSVVEPSMKQ
eukprot:gene16600-22840_t